MSYISKTSSEILAKSNASHWDDCVDRAHAAAPDTPSVKLAAWLEIGILLAMLSGLSLAFCTIAAGAF